MLSFPARGNIEAGHCLSIPHGAGRSPDTLLFIVTTGDRHLFHLRSFPKINAFILAQLPSGFRQRLEGLGADLRGSFGGLCAPSSYLWQ